MKKLKKGGDLIGKGAYGCVFNVEFPCRNKRTIKNKDVKYISKIFFHVNAVKEAKLEFEMNKNVNKIKGNSNWCVLWSRICRPDSYAELYKYDKKIADCLKQSGLNRNQFNKRSAMLIGKYGGKSMENIFSKEVKKINNKQEFNDFFLNFMKSMVSLFEGVKALKDNGLTHSDIKRGNIVLDGNKLKIIDFGLAYNLNNNDEYIKRSNRQYYDDRIYTPYPIDFIYTHTKKEQEKIDQISYSNNEPRRNFDEYLNIHQRIFKRNNIKEKIIRFLKNVNVDKKNILETLDVYSLGYLIPKAFFNELYSTNMTLEKLIEYIEDPAIKPFITLFKDMTRETFFNEGPRISPEEAYNRFSALVRNIN